MRFSFQTVLAASFVTLTAGPVVRAADWPAWGRDASRNAVSPEKNAPIDFRFPEVDKGKVVKPGRGIAWHAKLGSQTVIPPVVADGLVWIGTNARQPDDENIPAKDWDGGVLMCFRESDGKLLWKQRTPRLSGNGVEGHEDFGRSALGSAPLIEGDRLWYVNNRNEVVCLNIAPLKKQTGTPTEVWKLDMRKDLDVRAYLPLMQFGFAASLAGYKDKLYVVTHNGINWSDGKRKVSRPDAPSLICVAKSTGRVLWKDNSPGKNILDCQISSPLVAEVNGRPQVIVGQGDGWLRSFEPTTGKILWKCDLNAKDAIFDPGAGGNWNHIVATPILYDGRVYIAPGRDAEHGDGEGCLYCIDPTKDGDISLELEAGPMKGKPNPNAAVVWHTRGPIPADLTVTRKKKDRPLNAVRDWCFGRTIASCTAHDGLVYAVDWAGYFFCFDAKTGQSYWVEDLYSAVYGQPLWADGKIYVSTEDGDIFVFAHGKERKPLAKIPADDSSRPGLVFANGTLYVTRDTTLYAVRKPRGEEK